MALQSQVILDQSKNLSLEEWSLGDAQPQPGKISVTKRRLRGGLSEGVDEIRVHNGSFSFSVLPTRGMSLWKAWSGDEEIGWKSPVRGPVHPSLVPNNEPSGLGWLDGFDELLVRCGLESNGAPEFDEDGRLKYPLHGRIGNKPAREVSVEIDSERDPIECTIRQQQPAIVENGVVGAASPARPNFGYLSVCDRHKQICGQPPDPANP